MLDVRYPKMKGDVTDDGGVSEEDVAGGEAADDGSS